MYILSSRKTNFKTRCDSTSQHRCPVHGGLKSPPSAECKTQLQNFYNSLNFLWVRLEGLWKLSEGQEATELTALEGQLGFKPSNGHHRGNEWERTMDNVSHALQDVITVLSSQLLLSDSLTHILFSSPFVHVFCIITLCQTHQFISLVWCAIICAISELYPVCLSAFFYNCFTA